MPMPDANLFAISEKLKYQQKQSFDFIHRFRRMLFTANAVIVWYNQVPDA